MKRWFEDEHSKSEANKSKKPFCFQALSSLISFIKQAACITCPVNKKVVCKIGYSINI